MIFNEISGVVKRACRESNQTMVAKKYNLTEKVVSAIVNGMNYSISYDVMLMMRNLGYDIKLVKRNPGDRPVNLDEKCVVASQQGYDSYGKWELARFLEEQKLKGVFKKDVPKS